MKQALKTVTNSENSHEKRRRYTAAVAAIGGVAMWPVVLAAGTVTGTVGVVIAPIAAVTSTSSLLFSTPAPVGNLSFFTVSPQTTADTTTTETTDTSDTGDETTTEAQRLAASAPDPRFASSPASFGVFGLPNQTFSIALPRQTSFQSGGLNVSFSDFVHNAGSTPSIGQGGNSVFNVGAAINVSTATGETAAADPGTSGDTADTGGGDSTDSGDDGDGNIQVAEALPQSSPYINVIVSYN